jgi:hypothetical protein
MQKCIECLSKRSFLGRLTPLTLRNGLRDLVVRRNKGVAGHRDRKARLSEKEGPNGNENSLERWNAMISQTLSWTQRFLQLLCLSGKQNVFVFSPKEAVSHKAFWILP